MNSQARKQKPSGYWTKERVFEEAKKYTSRKAFSNGNGTAYKIASKNGWLDEMPWMNIAPKNVLRNLVNILLVAHFKKEVLLHMESLNPINGLMKCHG